MINITNVTDEELLALKFLNPPIMYTSAETEEDLVHYIETAMLNGYTYIADNNKVVYKLKEVEEKVAEQPEVTEEYIYITKAVLPETPNWDRTHWSYELIAATEQGYKFIQDGKGTLFKINNKDSVTGTSMQDYIEYVQMTETEDQENEGGVEMSKEEAIKQLSKDIILNTLRKESDLTPDQVDTCLKLQHLIGGF